MWRIVWSVSNLAADALTIISVRLPHGKFKAAERSFAPAFELAAGATKEFISHVDCDEPAGLVTENAFVIIHCQWRGAAWRIFVRIRVKVNAAGAPAAATELITTQRIGFSGIPN
ncbi:MAG: hypothetical protein EXR70_04595 [Deltaproteobacteria bacterium]|nr:hypothetical protein [Deltaproteobacteria bacterium]